MMQQLTAAWGLSYYFNQQKAIRLAQQNRWAMQQKEANGALLSLQGLDEAGRPHYYASYNNQAASNTRTNLLWTGNRLGYNLTGASSNLSGRLGFWDGGRVRGTHQELIGRVTQQDNPFAFDNHATHVAGTLIAAGILPAAKGMAFGAQLKAWDFNNDTPEIAAAAGSLIVSNHSYGSLCGWRGTGRGWEWWGEPSLSEIFDWKFGFYTNSARDWDIIAYQTPYYLMVKSAGNNRDSNGPPAGTPYFIANSDLSSTVPRSRNDGYDIVTTNGTAKNILTIGAANPISNGYQQPSDVISASFSSWGPTDDGRIKPDLVGIGVNVLSTGANDDQAYFASGGTSMSAPNVAGSLLLLQEYYSRLNRGNFMRSATLKGLALHTANEAGNAPGPDYVFGWGLLNAEKAASVISNPQGNHLLQERELSQNQTYSFQVFASGKGPLEVTICWTDPEGTVSLLTPQSVNDRTPKLVNDLDVRITQENQTYLPWTLDPDNPAQAAVPGDNIRDNVEKIFIPDAVPGKSYLVSISHKGTLQRAPQAYSIIVSGIGGKAYCASKAMNSSGTKIDQFAFGSIQYTATGNCATYTDLTNLTASVTTGQSIPLSLRLGTCGDDTPKVAKVFVDWNGDADFDDPNELVATTPPIQGTDTYQTNVGIPAGIVAGNFSRIRIVCRETGDPDEVSSCGSYPQGETQDYRIAFLAPAKDVGVVDLPYPEQTFCSSDQFGGTTVVVRNYGTTAQSNIPVSVEVSEDNGAVVGSLTGILIGPLYPGNEASLVLSGVFNALPGKKYTFNCRTALTVDADPSNNAFVANRSTSTGTASPSATASICGNDATVLQGTGNGTLFWYDAPTGGNLLAVGNKAYTNYKPDNLTYYVALNEFYDRVGPPSKSVFSGGNYGQHTGEIQLTTQAPLILERARLYVGQSGRITFTVKNQKGNIVSGTTLNVLATRNPAVAGDASDDASDQGAVYYLNLRIPEAGTYSIAASYEGGATLFRSTVGVTGYPFAIPQVVSITGSSSGNNTYLYLYDTRFRAAGCTSSRVAVVAQAAAAAVATIDSGSPIQICKGDSTLLKANQGDGFSYQWQKEGINIEFAEEASLWVGTSGNYTVTVTNATGCKTTSSPVEVKVNNITPIPVTIVPSSSPELCSAAPVNITLKAITGLDPNLITFQWYKNEKVINQANQSTYLATEAGEYTVMVSQPSCQMSLSLPLKISQEDIQLTVSSGTICGGSGSAELTAQTNQGTVVWYDAPVGGNLIATGSTYTTPTLTSDKSYYVGVNEFSGTLSSPNIQTGGGFSAFTTYRTYFSAYVPFMLKKASLHIGQAGAGPRTVKVELTDRNFSNRVIASTVLSVNPGVAEYDLNLYVPAPGHNYGLAISAFGGGAEAYAHTSASNIQYPYVLPGIVAITGNNQANQGSFFGYLYNWKIQAEGCASTKRAEAKVKVLISTPSEAKLSSNTSDGIQTICQGQNAMLKVDLKGTPPWSITYTDGQTPVTIQQIQQTPYMLPVKEAGTYSLLSVADDRSCANGMVSGTATVKVIEAPSDYPDIITSGPIEFCIGGSVTLIASLGFDKYLWSTGETSRSILVQQSGKYWVAGGKLNCYGPPSREISISAQPTFDQATILASGPLSFCVGDSVILSAPQGYSLYTWSNRAKTRSITVKTSGQYQVKVGYPGCVSDDSSPVTVAVSQEFPPKPEITTLGNRLTSSSEANNQWLKEGTPIPGATQATYVAPTSGTYTVKVANGSCSVVSNEVAIWVTSLDEPQPTDTGVRIYPNPGQHNFSVEYTSGRPSSSVLVHLCNALGVELMKQPLQLVQDSWQGTFEVNLLPAGVYFIKIVDGQKLMVRPWIKQ
jgi:hypothetical protein